MSAAPARCGVKTNAVSVPAVGRHPHCPEAGVVLPTSSWRPSVDGRAGERVVNRGQFGKGGLGPKDLTMGREASRQTRREAQTARFS